MKITLANGTELNPILVTGGAKYVQGQNRDTLNFIFPETEDITELDAAFTAANCESITVTDESGAEHIHKGYTIRAELSKKAVEITPATDESEAVYEDRITVSMSRRTYVETQLAELNAAVNALTGEG